MPASSWQNLYKEQKFISENVSRVACSATCCSFCDPCVHLIATVTEANPDQGETPCPTSETDTEIHDHVYDTMQLNLHFS